MNKLDYKIHIVGAGVSGLIAASVLEDSGYHPTVLEASDAVGGRVKTDIVNGTPLDYGFQVLLTAYPMVKKYLNLAALELCYFLPGASIFYQGSKTTIGDPMRNLSLLLPTVFSNTATISDKIKILRLQTTLRKKSLEAIFNSKEINTLQYLKDKGFSDTIIERFFKPFFSGIFLEDELQTSSRMFEFVYKMFGEGLAAIPQKGIQAIPEQLKSNLKKTAFQFNAEVAEVKDNQIVLRNGTKLDSHFAIIGTEANQLVSNLRKQEVQWKACDTLYFSTPKTKSSPKLIGLIADQDAIINNVVSLTDLFELSNTDKVLSVTVVKQHGLTSEELIKKVSNELKEKFDIEKTEVIKHYKIKKALPDIFNLKNDLAPEETRLTTRIFLAGELC
jgi:protoporphyrinogen oxidase